MSSQAFKELSNQFPGWTSDLDKIQDFLSIRSKGEFFGADETGARLDITSKKIIGIFNELTKLGVLEEKNPIICDNLSCGNNVLTEIDDSSFECDICDNTYELSQITKKKSYELKKTPPRTFKRNGETMLNGFMNSTVDLIKKDGTSLNDIPASVQTNKIFINNTSIPIEDGDHLINKLSNGTVDKYEVIDHGFKPMFAGIPAHYQVRVKKSGIESKTQPIIQNTYHLGAHARFNNQSTDNSNNSVTYTQNQTYSEMKRLLDVLDAPLALQVESKINELQASENKEGFLKKYKEIFELAGSHVDFITKLMPLIAAAQQTFQ